MLFIKAFVLFFVVIDYHTVSLLYHLLIANILVIGCTVRLSELSLRLIRLKAIVILLKQVSLVVIHLWLW